MEAGGKEHVTKATLAKPPNGPTTGVHLVRAEPGHEMVLGIQVRRKEKLKNWDKRR